MKRRFTFLLLVLYGYMGIAQIKYEKEERILKEELPTVVEVLLPKITQDAKRVRYFKCKTPYRQNMILGL